MVLKAQTGGYDVGRVFMDARSGINLIYARTLKAMCISLESLKPTDSSFHGIVPGGANYPLGRIELDVIRSHGLAFAVSCNPGVPSICKIHGSSSLRISNTQNSRT
jgi:hypothetical protein